MEIQLAGNVTQEAFRDLIIEQVPRLCGEDARIEAHPELDSDHALLVRCGDHEQVLVAFDLEDPNRALLQGLVALDQMAHANADAETGESALPDLMVLSPAPPAGNSLLSRLRGFQWRPCKLLDIDGRLGLLVEPPADIPSEPARLRPAPRDEDGTPLSPEESAFFDHL
ncbi:hypothetical protein [Thiohalobacter sp.]|uniref:hypothetical protein n=1 Tax=Thiohalobacter sp. TaxID=2025948 RepID=UPI002624BE9C|nr:hypothetical protein [Thiohalobacter sp.]